MEAARRRKLWLVLAIASGLCLPLALLAALLLFNPYAILLGRPFSVANSLPEAVLVTPVAGRRMASGEHRWVVLPQLAVPFLAAPAWPQARLPISPGETRTIRANFDDVSLGALAVATAAAPDRAMMVDPAAAAGACCYAPRNAALVIAAKDLVKAPPAMLEAVAAADRGTASRLATWYGLVAGGVAVAILFAISVRRYRTLRRGGP